MPRFLLNWKKNTKNEFRCVMAMSIRPIFYLKIS